MAIFPNEMPLLFGNITSGPSDEIYFQLLPGEHKLLMVGYYPTKDGCGGYKYSEHKVYLKAVPEEQVVASVTRNGIPEADRGFWNEFDCPDQLTNDEVAQISDILARFHPYLERFFNLNVIERRDYPSLNSVIKSNLRRFIQRVAEEHNAAEGDEDNDQEAPQPPAPPAPAPGE